MSPSDSILEVETYTVSPDGRNLGPEEPVVPMREDKGFDLDDFEVDLDEEEDIDVDMDPMDRVQVIRQDEDEGEDAEDDDEIEVIDIEEGP